MSKLDPYELARIFHALTTVGPDMPSWRRFPRSTSVLTVIA